MRRRFPARLGHNLEKRCRRNYLHESRAQCKPNLAATRQFKEDVLSATGSMKDARDFGIGAQIIISLNKNIDLVTNNPIKRVGVAGYGLEIVKNSALE